MGSKLFPERKEEIVYIKHRQYYEKLLNANTRTILYTFIVALIKNSFYGIVWQNVPANGHDDMDGVDDVLRLLKTYKKYHDEIHGIKEFSLFNKKKVCCVVARNIVSAKKNMLGGYDDDYMNIFSDSIETFEKEWNNSLEKKYLDIIGDVADE